MCKNKIGLYEATKPCSNCPYRKDAPLQHWHKEEFQKVVDSENDYMGKTFACHKQNGSICVGWLMNQEKRGLPSIALRLSLTKHNVHYSYLESLSCNSEMYEDWKEMVEANFPELLEGIESENPYQEFYDRMKDAEIEE